MTVVTELQSSSGDLSLLLTSLFKIFLWFIKILVATVSSSLYLHWVKGYLFLKKLLWITLLSFFAGGTDVLHSDDRRGKGFHCNYWPTMWAQLGWCFNFCLFCGFHYPGGQGMNVSGITIYGKLVKFWNRARTIQGLGWISWSLSKCMGCPLVPRGQTWV